MAGMAQESQVGSEWGQGRRSTRQPPKMPKGANVRPHGALNRVSLGGRNAELPDARRERLRAIVRGRK